MITTNQLWNAMLYHADQQAHKLQQQTLPFMRDHLPVRTTGMLNFPQSQRMPCSNLLPTLKQLQPLNQKPYTNLTSSNNVKTDQKSQASPSVLSLLREQMSFSLISSVKGIEAMLTLIEQQPGRSGPALDQLDCQINHLVSTLQTMQEQVKEIFMDTLPRKDAETKQADMPFSMASESEKQGLNNPTSSAPLTTQKQTRGLTKIAANTKVSPKGMPQSEQRLVTEIDGVETKIASPRHGLLSVAFKTISPAYENKTQHETKTHQAENSFLSNLLLPVVSGIANTRSMQENDYQKRLEDHERLDQKIKNSYNKEIEDSFLNGNMLLIGGKSLFRGNYKWLTFEEKQFLENRFQRNPKKWTIEETGLYAKMLGVPRKKITMWRWHRTKREQKNLENILGSGTSETFVEAEKKARIQADMVMQDEEQSQSLNQYGGIGETQKYENAIGFESGVKFTAERSSPVTTTEQNGSVL